MRKLLHPALLASSAALAVALPAHAQDTENQDSAEVELAEASPAGQGEIIVTARRTDERLQDVPVAVTAFDSQALERSTVQELSDVRSIASGLNFNSEGGKSTTNVSLRGIRAASCRAHDSGCRNLFQQYCDPQPRFEYPYI